MKTGQSAIIITAVGNERERDRFWFSENEARGSFPVSLSIFFSIVKQRGRAGHVLIFPPIWHFSAGSLFKLLNNGGMLANGTPFSFLSLKNRVRSVSHFWQTICTPRMESSKYSIAWETGHIFREDSCARTKVYTCTSTKAG